MMFDAVIVAAGSGARFGAMKQLLPLAGKPVLRWSAEALSNAGARRICVVAPEGKTDAVAQALAGLDRCSIVVGGAARSASVRAGLAQLKSDPPDAVLIHDAARPFVTSAHVQALLAALEQAPGAVPALPVSDTLKRAADGEVSGTVDRDGLWRAQTPQAFRFRALLSAWAAWDAAEEPTDDAAVLERNGQAVALVAGDPLLMKITVPEDLLMAERLAGAARTVRVGQGFDAHRWEPGDAVWLCGVRIDHDRRLSGHSDADAGLHALTDAVLGAIGEGDIGDWFPPSDPRWKGASSDQFLAHAVDRVRRRGGRILNVDVTLVCEQPRIKPHREAMRARVAEILGLAGSAVSVKATTTEGMGFTGRGEGLAAQAIATVELPA